MFLKPEDLRKFKFEIEAADVYPKGVNIPSGHEIIDFDPPVAGEEFVTIFNTIARCTINDDFDKEPRLIVAPSPQRDWQSEIDTAAGGPNWKVPEGWRVVGYRPPKAGELYASPLGIVSPPLKIEKTFKDFREDKNGEITYEAGPRLILEKLPRTFTFDGVEFTQPEGWEFVRVGYLKPEEKAKGWMSAYMNSATGVREFSNHYVDPAAIFRPLPKN